MNINQRNPKNRTIENKAGSEVVELTTEELTSVNGGRQKWSRWLCAVTETVTSADTYQCTEHDSCDHICMSA
ncbi:hypothetical protein [Psychrobium sp. 1_MG-2023]|uniref:hypothetical protein n=1 Tax=Psychrobium sp. 1_MG-2023 TaxID=3062624 RepID=UPI000C32687F|nr:hypothetical protein [Psychrobium sp. 1_MG-2023]MDP2562144.1 hypothetical protein [Psychrobium sp. 1_MG-2023]PKF57181.1 hypothetical protein CW748_07275 [Alteromonadales bacterium alter-6D02]